MKVEKRTFDLSSFCPWALTTPRVRCQKSEGRGGMDIRTKEEERGLITSHRLTGGQMDKRTKATWQRLTTRIRPFCPWTEAENFCPTLKPFVPDGSPCVSRRRQRSAGQKFRCGQKPHWILDLYTETLRPRTRSRYTSFGRPWVVTTSVSILSWSLSALRISSCSRRLQRNFRDRSR